MNALHHSASTGLAYRDEGRGKPILLIHGWGVSGELFQQQIEALSQSYRVVVPDLPGHGASKRANSDFEFSHCADCIAGLIQELELRDFFVVGWSMGSMITWDLLLRYPQLECAGLVCIDMAPRLLNLADWNFGLRDGEGVEVFDQHLADMVSDWPAFTDVFVPRIFSSLTDEHTPDLVARAVRVALANDPRQMAAAWARMAQQDFREGISEINLPCLVIMGRNSRLYGVAAGEWVASQMPQAQCVVFSHSGHSPHIEEPERFNQVILEFVDSLVVRQGTSATSPASSGHKS